VVLEAEPWWCGRIDWSVLCWPRKWKRVPHSHGHSGSVNVG